MIVFDEQEQAEVVAAFESMFNAMRDELDAVGDEANDDEAWDSDAFDNMLQLIAINGEPVSPDAAAWEAFRDDHLAEPGDEEEERHRCEDTFRELMIGETRYVNLTYTTPDCHGYPIAYRRIGIRHGEFVDIVNGPTM